MDPIHEVVVSAEANGPAHVILTHENEAEHLEPHGPWLEALLVIGQASSDLFKDHVLSFHALEDGRRPDLVHLEKPTFSRFEVPFFRLAVTIYPGKAPILRGDMLPYLRQDHPRPRVMRC